MPLVWLSAEYFSSAGRPSWYIPFERYASPSTAYEMAKFASISLGRSAEALEVAKGALDLDPASPAVSHSLAVQLYLARKFDRAIEQAHETLEMDANFAISYAVLGEAYQIGRAHV